MKLSVKNCQKATVKLAGSLLFAVVFISCDNNYTPQTKPKFSYSISYTIGMREIRDVSIGEIKYLDGGRIKFLSYNYGHPDSVIVGGTYVIENYR